MRKHYISLIDPNTNPRLLSICSRNSFTFALMKQNKTIITAKDFIEAEDQYINLSDEELKQLAESSAQEQPALFVFVAAYYEGLKEEENKEFFLQLIYSIWIAYKNKYKLKRKLSIQEIEKLDEEEEKLLSKLYENEDEIITEALKRMTQHPQPELTGHLYEMIGDFFDFTDLEDEDIESGSVNDSGIISGAVNLFVNLLEKAKENLYVS
jgi:hypothetical protein